MLPARITCVFVFLLEKRIECERKKKRRRKARDAIEEKKAEKKNLGRRKKDRLGGGDATILRNRNREGGKN